MSTTSELVERLKKRISVEMCSFGPNKPYDIGANDGPNWMRYLPKAEQVTADIVARLSELERENARLREALKPFAWQTRVSSLTEEVMILNARAALAGSGER
jgi:hypothetical protein